MAFTKNNKPTEPNKPVMTFRAGVLAVSIWKRANDKGVWYSATPSRAYTEKDSDEWKYSDQFNRDDLPVIAGLMQMAFGWIVREEGKEKAQ